MAEKVAAVKTHMYVKFRSARGDNYFYLKLVPLLRFIGKLMAFGQLLCITTNTTMQLSRIRSSADSCYISDSHTASHGHGLLYILNISAKD